MYTNVNLAAGIGVLLFIGTAALIFGLVPVLIFSLLTKRFRLAKLTGLAFLVVGALYLSLLLIFSWSSSEKVLARGQEKHFCEIDCHLACSIVESRATKTLGEAGDSLVAVGLFRVITIKTRFDEDTISPRRGNGLLYPNSRVVVVIDAHGKQYFPSATVEQLLQRTNQAGVSLSSPLRPSENYQTMIVFDLPADIQSPALLIREDEFPTHFVIGHENSPLHKQTKFQI